MITLPRPGTDAFHATELRAVRFLTMVAGFMALVTAAVWAVFLRAVDVPGGSLRIFAAILAVPGILAIFAPVLPLRGVRAVAGLVALAQVVLAGAILAHVWTGTPIDVRALWPFSITAISTSAALVAGGQWAAWVTLISLTALLQLLRLANGGAELGVLVNDWQAFLGSVIVLVLGRVFLARTRDVDRAVNEAMRAEERSASSNGRRAAQQHAQALVHDDVLATLLLVRQDLPALRSAVTDQAGRVLRRIVDLERDMDDAPVRRSTFNDRIARAVARIAPGTSFDASSSRGEPLEAPVADALVTATEQALINSVQHAGAATRAVAVEHDGNAVTVTIDDTGQGFDIERVPDDRLGVTSSIVGRMRAVGGDAHVTSAPDRGTTVRLVWQPTVHEPWRESAAAPPRARHSVRRLVVAYCLFEAAIAGLIMANSDDMGAVWATLLALGGIVVSLAVIGWRDLSPLSRPRALAAVAIAALSSSIATALGSDEHAFVSPWVLTAAAFVLAAVALRGQIMVAFGGLGVIVFAAISVVATVDLRPFEAAGSIGRPIVVVGVAALAADEIRRLWRRTLDARAELFATLRRTAGSQAARAELRARAEELDELVGPTLTRIRDGEHSDDLRAESTALEGQLRDRFRGGRLARPPVTEAARRARQRGVDVVLLDDAGARDLSDDQLDEVAEWMAARIDAIAEGRFTGRLLPPHNQTLASAVIGTGVETFSI